MAIITYPVDNIEYNSSDAATYNSPRTSGVYSSDDHFKISVTGDREVTISPGLAWVHESEFSGHSMVSTSAVSVLVPSSADSLPRKDLLVFAYDPERQQTTTDPKGVSYFYIKQGTPATNPTAPQCVKTSNLYELGLYIIDIPAQSTKVYDSDITSVILDESYCGVMRDGVTGIPTQQLQDRALEVINELIAALNTDFNRVVTAQVSRTGVDGDPSCNLQFEEQPDGSLKLIFDFKNIDGKDGVSVTHAFQNNVLTFSSASGSTTINFNDIKYYKELARFTADGKFTTSGTNKTIDDRYDIELQGGGNSGQKYRSASSPDASGGDAGSYYKFVGVPLLPNTEYAVQVGSGGKITNSSDWRGTVGKPSTFKLSHPGTNPGINLSSDSEASAAEKSFISGAGTSGQAGQGGNSYFGKGGRNSYTGQAGHGGCGAGGGGGGYISGNGGKPGNGGNGIVIIKGWIGGR